MKNIMVKGTCICLMISGILSCNEKKEESTAVVIDKEQIKKDIQAREDEFAALYNAGEMKNIGYYDDSAITFYPNRAPLVGKAAIADFLMNDLISNTDKLSFKTNEVFPSSDGKQIIEVGYFKLVDSSNATINTGNYMSLFEKRDGKYVCLRDMSASDIPAN
jgi:ketosteroid isomerase-like protein